MYFNLSTNQNVYNSVMYISCLQIWHLFYHKTNGRLRVSKILWKSAFYCLRTVQLRMHMEETCCILFTKWIWSTISCLTTSLVRTPSRFRMIYKYDTFFSMEQKCLRVCVMSFFSCAPMCLSREPYNFTLICFILLIYY